MDKNLVSDLFFNSFEIITCKDFIDYISVLESAKAFLSLYPAIEKEFSPVELANDFMNRI